jgi:hypothetical protein
LARESAGQHVYRLDLGEIHLADVLVDRLARPAQGEDFAGVWGDFAKPRMLKSGPFKAEVAASGSRKKAAYFHHGTIKSMRG